MSERVNERDSYCVCNGTERERRKERVIMQYNTELYYVPERVCDDQWEVCIELSVCGLGINLYGQCTCRLHPDALI